MSPRTYPALRGLSIYGHSTDAGHTVSPATLKVHDDHGPEIPPAGPGGSHQFLVCTVPEAYAAPDLAKALELMLRDYRTDGCPHKKCRVCRDSSAAKQAALSALAKSRGEES